MRSLLLCLPLLSMSVAAFAAEPMVQLNYPVLARGESAVLRLQLAAHPGGLAAYSIRMQHRDNGDSGFRVASVQCPEGFFANLYDQDLGAVCYRVDDTPHPSLEMRVRVYNAHAADGHTRWEEGLWTLDGDAAALKTAWHLFAVEP